MSDDVLFVSPDDVETIKALLREGKPLVFATDMPGLIKAEWLHELVDPETREIDRDIRITNAFLEGDLYLEGVNFLGQLSLNSVIIRDALHFYGATFRIGLRFSRCTLREHLSLVGASVHGDLLLSRLVADKHVYLDDLHITGSIYVPEIEIHGEISAVGLIVDRDFLAPSSQFWGDISLHYARIGRLAAFDGAVFRGEIRFDRARFEGGISFSSAQFHKFASFGGIYCAGFATFSGDEAKGSAIFYSDLNFMEAVFHGRLDFEAVYFGGESTFTKTTCLGPAFFRRAQFAGDVSFLAAQFKESVILDGVAFHSAVDFERAVFEQSLLLRSSSGCQALFAKEANFSYVHIYGTGAFESVEFRMPVSFHRAVIDGVASFAGCQFAGQANFSEFRLGDSLVCGPDKQDIPVVFSEETIFSSMVVQSWVDFTFAVFRKQALFRGTHVLGDMHFGDTRFYGDARFDYTVIEGNATFGSSDRQVANALFHAGMHFSHTRIGGKFDFSGVKVAKTADFTEVHFDGPADFRRSYFSTDSLSGPQEITSFASARFRSSAFFTDTEFKGRAIFGFTEANQLLDFQNTKFRDFVSFLNAKFNFVYFAKDNSSEKRLLKGGFGSFSNWLSEKVFPPRPTISTVELEAGQFGGVVDLRGMNVDRIYVDWQELLSQQVAFDRQPYAELEAAYRRIGEDDLAKDVYYARRIKDLGRTFGHIRGPSGIVQAGMEFFRWGIAGYGVRPARFFVILVGFFGAGIGIYAMPGAATLRAESVNPSTTSPVINLSLQDAFFVSLDHLLPSPVEIFAARNWIPTDHVLFQLVGIDFTSARFATIQGILAWIFIPTLIVIIGKALWRPID